MSNNWLTEEGKSQIEFYLSSKEEILIERKQCIELLISLFSMNFKEKKSLTILDLGCGNGVITEIIESLFPENQFVLLDGSDEMMSAAKEKLKGDKFIFIHKTFEEYIKEHFVEEQYDFIFSSMAIHHLDYIEKQKMYGKLYHELNINGLFLNYDVVLPTTQLAEKWQFAMWTDWINENLKKTENADKIGSYDDLPDIYKNKSENKPSELCSQLEMLKIAGYQDIDCFFRYANFALFGGRKL